MLNIFLTKLMAAYQLSLFYCYLYPERTAASVARIYCTGSLVMGTTIFILNAWLETKSIFRIRRRGSHV